MPLNPECHICHGDPEMTMICSACHWDLDTAFHQIIFLQCQIRYLQEKTGHKYVAPKIGEAITEGTFPTGAFPNLNVKKPTLEDTIRAIDGRSLQRIFREVDESVLSTVLYSLKEKDLVDKIRNNLSRNHFNRLIQNIKDGIGSSGTESAADQFLRVVRQLDEMGEIVVSRDGETDVPFDYRTPGVPVNEVVDWLKEYKERERVRREEFNRQVAEWLKMVES